jgi:capsid protein
MVAYHPPGKQVTVANPPGLTSDALATRTLRKFAAGLGVTYEDVTGDYSNVNFSSARMGRIAHWANVEYWRESIVIPLLCQGVWNWAMSAAVIAGEIPAAPGAQWTSPGMPMIEPDKEGLALQRMVRTGAKTFSEMVREQGYDPDDHWAEYAADVKKLDALGLVLDSDARKTTSTGQEQASETAQNSPPLPAVTKPPKAP